MAVNAAQITQLLLQVFFVGLMLGMTRTVVPVLAESEFGVAPGDPVMLVTFVAAFGFVKAVLNVVAGQWAEKMGRKKVLVAGWLAALPIPFMILFAPGWSWVVAAMLLLGINQGLAWSMTQTSTLDLAGPSRRGLAIGLNEFSGYLGVVLAGLVTAWLATALGAREGLAIFGTVVVLIALVASARQVQETLPWAHAESATSPLRAGPQPRYPQQVSGAPTPGEIFTLMSWRDPRMAALCQAGLVEKFVDALVWVIFPVYLYQRGATLTQIGWIVGVYGFAWGGAQLFVGPFSDRVGRKKLIVAGMWLCALGVALVPMGEGRAVWTIAAAVTGGGMALLYPTLSAAVSDIAHPAWRATAIGIYRFWRDAGYGIGALLLGVVSAAGGLLAGFWFVATAMLVSGAWLAWRCEETHPDFNPA
jgi:MFS family permease